MSTVAAVKSPITNSPNVVLEQTIDCQFLIDTYRSRLNIDVKKYFDGLEYVQIYRCQETGYRFYYPFDLEGDSDFYKALQIFPWYYVDWKWEFDVASKIIKAGEALLEIGCGRGAFIEKMQQKGVVCTGLEFNEDAVEVGRSQGLNIFVQSIQDHAKTNLEKYDVVCYFQVLEHIAAVKEFIQASIDVLKPGGTLIICVPNNDSFIIYDKNLVTNMPPHHMGLWNKKSLINLESVFDIKLKKVYFEPLSFENCDWYYGIQMTRLLKFTNKLRVFGKVSRKLSTVFEKPLLEFVKIIKHNIHDHSMLAVYKKNQ